VTRPFDPDQARSGEPFGERLAELEGNDLVPIAVQHQDGVADPGRARLRVEAIVHEQPDREQAKNAACRHGR
jgi:hypothetical protein